MFSYSSETQMVVVMILVKPWRNAISSGMDFTTISQVTVDFFAALLKPGAVAPG